MARACCREKRDIYVYVYIYIHWCRDRYMQFMAPRNRKLIRSGWMEMMSLTKYNICSYFISFQEQEASRVGSTQPQRRFA